MSGQPPNPMSVSLQYKTSVAEQVERKTWKLHMTKFREGKMTLGKFSHFVAMQYFKSKS